MQISKPKIVADIISFFCLSGVCLAISLWLDYPSLIAISVSTVLFFLSHGLWKNRQNSLAQEWLMFSAVAAILATISFGADVLVGKILHPDRDSLSAGTSTLGFLFTAAFCALSLCAFAWAIRTAILMSLEAGEAK